MGVKISDDWGTSGGGEAGKAGNEYGQSQDGPGKPSAASVLVDLALARYRFGCSPDGVTFGVPISGSHVVRPLRGGRVSLRAELASLYRKKTKRVAPQQALADALLILEGEAQEAAPETLHVRVAEHRGGVWIDLGDADNHVVHIAGGQWKVVTHGVPVLFTRSALTGALPLPEQGDMSELWSLLNVAPEDRSLLLGWLVAALGVPDYPHPILSLFGEQGTGKSTACRMLVSLVDPSPVPLRQPPRDKESWVTAASGSWVVGLDNMSSVPDWLSDTLCRASTGDGDIRRQLYTDSALSVFAFKRCVLLNGIDLGGILGDLSERLLMVQLETIAPGARMTERQLEAAWEAARPRVFGALLDEVAGMNSALPFLRLDKSPRMADFAHVLGALNNGGLERYIEQGESLAADSLSTNPFISAMITTLDAPFTGSAAELLQLVTPDGKERLPKGWPTARGVTTALKRNAPALRSQGWTVDDLGSDNKAGVTHWRVDRPEIARKSSPPSPLTRQTPPDLNPEALDPQGLCRLHHEQAARGCFTCDTLNGSAS